MSGADAIQLLMVKISNGEDMVASMNSLAALDIPLRTAIDLKIVETLSPLSRSPLLSGTIHEILKKLEGKKKTSACTVTKVLTRITSSKKILKKRRSSGGVKKSQESEGKENEKKRLFKKSESRKKDSAMWKKIGNAKKV